MATTKAKRTFDEDVEGDVRGSYAAVAHSGRNTGVGVLQRVARAFLKWDDSASRAARKNLERFASMSTVPTENVTWMVEKSFIDAFMAALVSSSENDRSDAEYLDAGDEAARHRRGEIRAATYTALSAGASSERVEALLDAMHDGTKRKSRRASNDERRA